MGHHHHHHHDHHGHHHVNGDDSVSRMTVAFFLNFAFAIIQLVGGYFTGSIAVTSGGLHDFGDSIAIGFAVALEAFSRRSSSSHKYSYGLRRLNLFSALVTAGVMVVGAVIILAESVPKIFAPTSPNTDGMLIFAFFGIAVNAYGAWRVKAGRSLSERMISWHLIEDLLGWVAVLLVSVVMRIWDWRMLDPLLGILITLYVLWGVARNLKSTLKLFLQAAPDEVTPEQIEKSLRSISGVVGVHDVHLWSLDGESHVLTLHVVVDQDYNLTQTQALKTHIRHELSHVAKLHVTIEIERISDDCPERNCVNQT